MVLIIAVFLIAFQGLSFAENTVMEQAVGTSLESSKDATNIDLPYYEKIMEIINSVEYSAFQVLVNPQVGLKMDFTQRTWSLKNVHQYDAKGNILLEQDRYGLCAELSTYVYQKIRSFVGKDFEFKFAMTTESGFFPTYQSNHIVLLMLDLKTKEVYLIDPSFRKYGRVKDLNEYDAMTVKDTLSFVEERSPDISLIVDQAMPFSIKNDLLLSFSITTLDGIFDNNNYLLVISASERNKAPGRDVFVVGKHKGKIQSYVNKALLEELLTKEQIKLLVDKIEMWLNQN